MAFVEVKRKTPPHMIKFTHGKTGAVAVLPANLLEAMGLSLGARCHVLFDAVAEIIRFDFAKPDGPFETTRSPRGSAALIRMGLVTMIPLMAQTKAPCRVGDLCVDMLLAEAIDEPPRLQTKLIEPPRAPIRPRNHADMVRSARERVPAALEG